MVRNVISVCKSKDRKTGDHLLETVGSECDVDFIQFVFYTKRGRCCPGFSCVSLTASSP